jgi:hypothetical protein
MRLCRFKNMLAMPVPKIPFRYIPSILLTTQAPVDTHKDRCIPYSNSFIYLLFILFLFPSVRKLVKDHKGYGSAAISGGTTRSQTMIWPLTFCTNLRSEMIFLQRKPVFHIFLHSTSPYWQIIIRFCWKTGFRWRKIIWNWSNDKYWFLEEHFWSMSCDIYW